MKTVTETRRCSARDTFLAESVHLVLMNIRSRNLWSPLRLPLPVSPRRLQSSFGRFDPLLFRQCPIFTESLPESLYAGYALGWARKQLPQAIFVRRCSVVCLCVSEFPVDLREWPQHVSPPGGRPSARSLWNFPAVRAGIILFQYMQS